MNDKHATRVAQLLGLALVLAAGLAWAQVVTDKTITFRGSDVAIESWTVYPSTSDGGTVAAIVCAAVASVEDAAQVRRGCVDARIDEPVTLPKARRAWRVTAGFEVAP